MLGALKAEQHPVPDGLVDWNKLEFVFRLAKEPIACIISGPQLSRRFEWAFSVDHAALLQASHHFNLPSFY